MKTLLYFLLSLFFISCIQQNRDLSMDKDGMDKDRHLAFSVQMGDNKTRAGNKELKSSVSMPIEGTDLALVLNEEAITTTYTRGGVQKDILPSFRLCAYNYPQAETMTAGNVNNVFFNQKCRQVNLEYMSIPVTNYVPCDERKTSSNPQSTDDLIYTRWQKDTKLSCYALMSEDQINYRFLGSKTDSGFPRIDVNIPTDAANQKDLLLAQNIDLVFNNEEAWASEVYWYRFPLTFYHALSIVSFRFSQFYTNKTLSKIELTNLYTSGTIVLNSTDSTNSVLKGQYTPHTEAEDPTFDRKTMEFNVPVGKGNITDEKIFLPKEANFFVFPQSINNDAKIIFTFANGTKREVLWKDITTASGASFSSFDQGKRIVVQIYPYQVGASSSLIGGDNFKVTERVVFDYIGGSCPFKVVDDNGNNVTNYSVQVSLDDGATYKNIDDIGQNSNWCFINGTAPNGDPILSALRGKEHIIENHTDDPYYLLKTLPEQGTAASPYNLAHMQGKVNAGGENTANCYVISNPGYYCFPLVFGNAIVDGENNPDAYILRQQGVNPRCFVAYNRFVSSPYLKQVYRTINFSNWSAELLWQDRPNLVQNVQIMDIGKGYVSFHIPKETMANGNAVIAIKNNDGKCLWSWHLWVTQLPMNSINDYIIIESQDGSQSVQSARAAIGRNYSYKEKTEYLGRECLLKFTKDGKDRVMKVVQNYGDPTFNVMGNMSGALYYQWGRKDPFPTINLLDIFNNEATPNFVPIYLGDGSEFHLNTQAENSRFSQWSGTPITSTNNHNETITASIEFPLYYQGDSFKRDNPTRTVLWSYRSVFTANMLVKTIFDPCPVGWRVPTNEENQIIFSNKRTASFLDWAFVGKGKDKNGKTEYINYWTTGNLFPFAGTISGINMTDGFVYLLMSADIISKGFFQLTSNYMIPGKWIVGANGGEQNYIVPLNIFQDFQPPMTTMLEQMQNVYPIESGDSNPQDLASGRVIVPVRDMVWRYNR